jgi:hypothetical protein
VAKLVAPASQQDPPRRHPACADGLLPAVAVSTCLGDLSRRWGLVAAIALMIGRSVMVPVEPRAQSHRPRGFQSGSTQWGAMPIAPRAAEGECSITANKRLLSNGSAEAMKTPPRTARQRLVPDRFDQSGRDDHRFGPADEPARLRQRSRMASASSRTRRRSRGHVKIDGGLCSGNR